MIERKICAKGSKRIWNRYTGKVPIDLFESKWDRNFNKPFQLPIYIAFTNGSRSFESKWYLVIGKQHESMTPPLFLAYWKKKKPVRRTGIYHFREGYCFLLKTPLWPKSKWYHHVKDICKQSLPWQDIATALRRSSLQCQCIQFHIQTALQHVLT